MEGLNRRGQKIFLPKFFFFQISHFPTPTDNGTVVGAQWHYQGSRIFESSFPYCVLALNGDEQLKDEKRMLTYLCCSSPQGLRRWPKA